MAEKKESYISGITEGEYALPDMKDYKAHGNATIKPCFSLNLIKDGNVRSFQYYHLESDSKFTVQGDEHHIAIRFDGTPVTIRGRNLWRLYDMIHQHRMPWVWEADRHFVENDDPILTGIEIGEKEQD